MKFSLKSILVFTLFSLPFFVFSATYTALQSIPIPGGGELYDKNILKYLANIYTFAIAIAGGLAVIKIVWAGAKYMLSDVVTNKSESIKEIQGAVYGLLMALGAFVFLETLNPNLVKFNLNISATKVIQGDATGLYNWVDTNPAIGPFYNKSGGSVASAIAEAAQFMKDNPYKNGQYAVTKNGRTACVYNVNEIVELATGEAAYSGLDIPGLDNALQNSNRFYSAGSDSSTLERGDIIVSNNGDRRHTGIYMGGGIIYSNDSTASANNPAGNIIIKESTVTNWNGWFGSMNVYRAR